MTISGCTFTSNTAGNDGGAIYSDAYAGGQYRGSTTVTGSTLTGNTARLYGGGIAGADQYSVFSLDAFTVANTVNNTDSSGLNIKTANIAAIYTLT